MYSLERGETSRILLLLVCSFLFHLIFIAAHPFYLDEVLYTGMIDEQKEHLTLVPTYLGYEAGWKPPLFFWVFSFITKISALMSNSFELVYRLPNILFAMANVVLAYLVFRKALGKEGAYFAAALYAFAFVFVYTNERLLIDTFATTMILASIYFYTGEAKGWKKFAPGGLFMFLAFLSKSFVAFVIPAVAVAYLFQNRRKELFSAAFIVSLAAIPLALGIHYFSLEKSVADEVFFIDMMGKLGKEGQFMERLGGTVNTLFVFLNILLVASIAGFAYSWKENYAMSAWFALGLLASIGSYMLPWYFYAVLPPMVFFAIRFMQRDPGSGKCVMDDFFKFVFVLAVGINILLAYAWFNFLVEVGEEKTVGLFLAGKGNVAIIGDYGPASTVIAYKLLEEKGKYGERQDFGWIIIPKAGLNGEILLDFMLDYRTDKYEVNEENFVRLFWTQEIFRKKTNASDFEYVVVSGAVQPEAGGYEKIYSGREIAVYKKD